MRNRVCDGYVMTNVCADRSWQSADRESCQCER